MNLQGFKDTLLASDRPAHFSVYLEALWYDGKGDWERSHTIIQDVKTKEASWIHTYLHRKEGDNSNADYWYSKAGKYRPAVSLKEEWEMLVTAFL